jgi:hypothetical protein
VVSALSVKQGRGVRRRYRQSSFSACNNPLICGVRGFSATRDRFAQL